MDGIYFFWFFWLMWVYIMFIMQKSIVRSQLLFLFLLIISMSSVLVDFFFFKISVAVILVLLYGYFQLGQLGKKNMIHTIVCSCVITLTYASFFLFAIFDPVWVILDIKWLVSASIVLLLFILTKGSRERLLALSIGLCHGDILYTAVLYYLHPNKIIGDYFFLDILAIALLVYSVWMLLISFVARLHTQYKRQQPKKTSF